jgi:hypothetical protein
VRALEAWLRRARIRRGPVFRWITAAGALDEQIMPHSRHKDASAMRLYHRRARIVVDNPAHEAARSDGTAGLCPETPVYRPTIP